jgi:hypothetical protein
MPDYIDRLKMPQSAVDALVKAVGDDLVRSIVADHYKGVVPAPSQVDRLVARFGPRDETR